MSSQSYFMRNNGVIAAAQVIWQSLALLIVYRVGAEAAGVGALGAWSTAVALSGLIILADLGVTDVMVREVAHASGLRDWPRVKGLCRDAARFVPLAVGAAGLLVAPVIAHVMHVLTPSLDDRATAALAAGAVATAWLTVLGVGVAGVLEAFNRYDLKAAAAFCSGALSIVAALGAARVAPDLALVFALATGAAANVLLLLVAALYLLRKLPGEPRPPTKPERATLLRLAWNARVGSLATLGLDPVVRFLLVRFGGAEAAGLYEIAYRLVFQLRAVLVASTQVIVPRLTHERARGSAAGMTAVSELTASLLRLAGPTLWGILIALPLLSAALLGRVDGMLLIYGLLLTLAWLVNAIAVPAYFGNFVDGALRTNRTSHLVMLVGAAALGTSAGMFFSGLGVVVGTSLAVALGTAVILVSRRHEIAKVRLDVTRGDYAVNAVGLLGAAVVYFAAAAAVPLDRQVYVALLVAALYAAVSTRFVARLVREHLRQVAG